MSGFTEVIGLAGSVVSLVLWWPQALLVWRCRRDPERLCGVSVPSQVLLVLNAVLWGAYAVETGSLWVGAPGLVNAPLAVLTIAILRRSAPARRDRGGPWPAGAPGRAPTVPRPSRELDGSHPAGR